MALEIAEEIETFEETDTSEDTLEFEIPWPKISMAPLKDLAISLPGQKLQINGDYHRINVDEGALVSAINHPGVGARRFGIWPFAPDKKPVRALEVNEGDSLPAILEGESGPKQVFDLETGVMSLQVPFWTYNPRVDNQDLAVRVEKSLQDQLKKGLLQRSGANIDYRRWRNFFWANLGIAALAGVETGQVLEDTSTSDRLYAGATVFAGTVILGSLLSFTKTRPACLTKAAISWADRRIQEGSTFRWLDKKDFKEPIFEVVPVDTEPNL